MVAKQILSSSKNASLLQGMVAGQFEYADLEKACTDYLRRHSVFSPSSSKYMDEQTLAERLDNGVLKAEVLTKIAEPLKSVTEQRAKQKDMEKKRAEKMKNSASRSETPRKNRP